MAAFSSDVCSMVVAMLLPVSVPPEQGYQDIPFRQVRAIHFRNEVDLSGDELRTVRADRDGKVLINTNKGLLKGYDERLVGGPIADAFGRYGELVLAIVVALLIFALARFLYRRSIFLRI